jgi:hypothetical protein
MPTMNDNFLLAAKILQSARERGEEAFKANEHSPDNKNQVFFFFLFKSNNKFNA